MKKSLNPRFIMVLAIIASLCCAVNILIYVIIGADNGVRFPLMTLICTVALWIAFAMVKNKKQI